MNDIKGIIEDVEKSSLVSDKVIKRVIEIIGQEEWNDIHDDESDICTTTGELIITLKGIAELEKENAELHVTNKSLLESCEGATMMYEDLCKTKEILHDLANLDGAVHIPMDKVKSLMVKAEKFLKN